MSTNGTTPAETPRSKHLQALAQVYKIPDDATPEEAMRICTAALNATHGRLAVIEGHMIEFVDDLRGFRRKHASHWVWPMLSGALFVVAIVEHLWPR